MFAFLDDDDDVFLADKLSVLAGEFASQPTLGYYHKRHRRIESGGAVPPVGAEHRPGGGSGHRFVVRPGDKPKRLLRTLWRSGAAFNLSSIATSRDLLESSRPYLAQIQLSAAAFLDFAALTISCSLVSDSRVLTGYRVRSGNISGTAAANDYERWRREIDRAPRLASDCSVILALLSSRGAPRSVRRPVEIARRRNDVLASLGGVPIHRGKLFVRIMQLIATSFPGEIRESRPHVRLGLFALRTGRAPNATDPMFAR